MTQYQRITGKVFGGNATATGNDPQIAQFGSALANTFVGTTDPATIQQLPAWGQGWIGAVTPETQFPPLPEMTGAMKVLSHQICGILQQGVSTWDSGTIYYTGNFVSLNGRLYTSQTDENQGNNPATDITNWKEFSSGGGSGFNLFDTKIADHILQGEEAKGWALQGTYVTKALYPDFYNKCLDEYKNEDNNKSYLMSNITKVGSVIDNNGVLSGFSTRNYATVNGVFPTSSSTWEMVLKVTTDAIGTLQEIINTTGTHALLLRLQTNGLLSLYLSSTGSSWDIASNISSTTTLTANTTYYIKITFVGTAYKLYLSTNGVNFQEEINIANSSSLYPSQICLGVRNNGTAVSNPFLGSIDLNNCYININGERWWAGIDVMTRNPNGHKFYPISIKSSIDKIFNQYGIAEFYGIDEENERILLPRNKYFHQLTLNTDEVNNMVEAGLPNPQIKIGTTEYGSSDKPQGTITSERANTTFDEVAYTGGSVGSVTLDFSLVNPIYGNSDTVQPPSSLKLLYYCVGNTVVNDAEIDAGGLVAQMETKANIQLDNVLPSQEFKNQAISWGIVDLPKQANPFNNNKIDWNTVFQLPCDALVAIGGSANNNNITLMYSYDSNVDNSYNTYKTSLFGYFALEYIATTVGVLPKGIYIKATGGTANQHLSYIPLKGANQ